MGSFVGASLIKHVRVWDLIYLQTDIFGGHVKLTAFLVCEKITVVFYFHLVLTTSLREYSCCRWLALKCWKVQRIHNQFCQFNHCSGLTDALILSTCVLQWLQLEYKYTSTSTKYYMSAVFSIYFTASLSSWQSRTTKSTNSLQESWHLDWDCVQLIWQQVGIQTNSEAGTIGWTNYYLHYLSVLLFIHSFILYFRHVAHRK